MLVGVWLVIMTGHASAHQSSTYDLDTSVSYIGESRLWLINRYDTRVTYVVEVLDKNQKPTTSKWRSNLHNNEVTLDTDQRADIVVQVKDKGKYYVCTTVKRPKDTHNITIRSRVCLRLWHR